MTKRVTIFLITAIILAGAGIVLARLWTGPGTLSQSPTPLHHEAKDQTAAVAKAPGSGHSAHETGTANESTPGAAKAIEGLPLLQQPAVEQRQQDNKDQKQPVPALSPAAESREKEEKDDIATLKSLKEKEVCVFISDKIKLGANIKKYVKTSILLGYKACPLIKCAVLGGGKLDEVVAGAVEAGAAHDVISKCCMEAGVSGGELAKTFAAMGSPELCFVNPEGLGYSPPGEELIPIDPTVLDRRTGGSPVSPSSF